VVQRLAAKSFRMADSDARFQQVFAWATGPRGTGEEPRVARQPARVWAHSSGAQVVRITGTDRATLLSIDTAVAPGFDSFLLDQMEELYSRFLSEGARKPRPRR
jgi:hypothetical protein